MEFFNWALVAYGAAIAVNKLAENLFFSVTLAVFLIGGCWVLLTYFENKTNGDRTQLKLLLAVGLGLFGGLVSWL